MSQGQTKLYNSVESHVMALLIVMVGGAAAATIYEVYVWSSRISMLPISAGFGSSTEAPAVRVTQVVISSNLLDAWRDQILSRPLFNETRRQTELVGRGVEGLPRLSGIILAGTSRFAMFAAQAGGAPIIVREGSRLGNYQVRHIVDSGVIIDGPKGTTVIRLSFDITPTVVLKLQLVPSPQRRRNARG